MSPQKVAILDVAQVLFSERGYEGLSIRDLALQCGLAKATIYHHFRDKEELLFSVLERDLAGLGTHVERAASAEEGPLAKLRAATSAYAQLLRQRRTGILWNLHGNDQLKQRLREFIQGRAGVVLSPWVAILQQGVSEGVFRPLNARLCALSLISMLNALVFYETHVSTFETDPVEHTLNLFVYGVIQQ